MCQSATGGNLGFNPFGTFTDPNGKMRKGKDVLRNFVDPTRLGGIWEGKKPAEIPNVQQAAQAQAPAPLSTVQNNAPFTAARGKALRTLLTDDEEGPKLYN